MWGDWRSTSPPQDAPHGAPHDGAADGAAHLAADRLADVAGNLARHAVADRTGYFPRDHLPGRKPCAACAIGAKYAPEHAADTAKHRSKAAGRLGFPRAAWRMRCCDRTACSAGL